MLPTTSDVDGDEYVSVVTETAPSPNLRMNRRINRSVLQVTSTKQHAKSPQPRQSSSRLRSNFLFKLGIPSPPHVSYERTVHPHKIILRDTKITKMPLKQHTCMRHDSSRPIKIPRKRDTEESRNSAADSLLDAFGDLMLRGLQSPRSVSIGSVYGRNHEGARRDEEHSPNSKTRHVQFDSNVSVVLIPARSDYSARISRFLWNSPAYMRRMVIQNTLEITADGWDCNAALEEKDHYFNPITNEYIHPVHLEIAQMPPEDQEAIIPDGYVNPALQRSLPSTPNAAQPSRAISPLETLATAMAFMS